VTVVEPEHVMDGRDYRDRERLDRNAEVKRVDQVRAGADGGPDQLSTLSEAIAGRPGRT
jgi:hypothetical protein